jgi:hypothetical protein
VRLVDDSTLLLYLDHGDLSRIADGDVPVAELSEAMRDCAANLLVSAAHVLDLAKADSGTKDRWITAIESVGTTRVAAEPSRGREVSSIELRRLLDDVNDDVQAYVEVANQRLAAAGSAREAYLAAPVHLSPTALRDIIGWLIDGTVGEHLGLSDDVIASHFPMNGQLRALLSEHGLDRDEIISMAMPQFETLLARGDLGELVRAHRSRDRRRKPRFSDLADEIHMQFAVHADIVTVDANVGHTMKAIAGKPFSIDGRTSARREIVVLPSGNLDPVIRTLRRLAAEDNSNLDGPVI